MKRIINKLILTFIFSAVLGNINVMAQVEAIPENYFVRANVRYQLDVMKNDNLGACASAPEDILLEITDPSTLPSNLMNLEVTADRKILFRTQSSFHGQVKFTYKITCTNGGLSSTADVYVNIGNTPDFVDDAECTVESVPFVWDVEKKGETDVAYPVQMYAQPFVGNLDDDENLEIVTLNNTTNNNGGSTSAQRTSNIIYIFNSNLTLKNSISVPFSQTYVTLPLALADVDLDGVAEIIYGTGWIGQDSPLNYILQAYKSDGTKIWESSTSYIENITSARFHSSAISVADLDGDGLVEIFCGDRIFAGENGNLLATLPSGGRGMQENASSSDVEGYLPAIGDIDGDGILEIVGGNTTYKIEINSRSNPDENNVTVVSQLVTQSDGYTSLADIDGDGVLDVVVVSKPGSMTGPCIMYVWQGNTDQLIGDVITNGTKGSRPFIGDINGDGRSDIAFTRTNNFDAYELNTNTNTFDLLFTVPTSDGSGGTTMSMFDFNLDGEVELVYRDQTHLRIIDKNGNNVKDKDGNEAIFPCLSGTHTEYPIVVDLDCDGHAEIIVSGALPGESTTNQVRLQVFGSKTEGTWAPARKVWNQHGYNPLYVNEDLSVPAKPLSPTTKIIHKDGTVHTPFNSFLQQSGVLNTEGESLNLAPDISFQVEKNQKMYHDEDTDVLKVTAFITNSGSTHYTGPLKLSLYLYDKTASTYTHIGSQTFTNQTINTREYKTYTFDIANYSSITLPAQYLWYVVLNMDQNGNSAPVQPPYDPEDTNALPRECNYWNNMTSRMSYISGQVILCKDETAVLNIEPAGAFDCYWYNPDKTEYKGVNGTDPTNIGDTKVVKKLTDNYKEYFLIDVYQKGTSNKITAAPDTVFIYNSPDSLVWTGEFDTDWNNILNWQKPDDPTKEELFSYIPRGCTNVLIPDNAPLYPDLSTTGTSYDIYADAACNNITFEHGGEVLNSDRLNYKKAYVQLELMSNRWYCFAPPLRDFYSGDIYLTEPNPFDDGILAFVRLFSQKEPQNNTYIEGNWGRTFSTPNQKFATGQAMGVWIDDWDPNPNNHQSMLFKFPKNDTQYWEYDEKGNPQNGPFATARTNQNRLIFEETFNSATKNVTLAQQATTQGKSILVGNPFMAHLDFKKFHAYANNADLIEDHYRIMDQEGNYSTYSISGVSTGNPVLTNLVAPMQAILLTPKTAFAENSLLANPSMTQNSPGNKLRSAQEEENNQLQFMRISISDSKVRNRCAMVYNQEAETGMNYNDQKDIYKILRQGEKSIANVYLITAEGFYMDIKTVSQLDNLSIKLGIATQQAGSMALGFERIWEFAPEYEIFLTDKLLNKKQNLRLSSIYSFVNDSQQTFIDDRFELQFIRSTTGIEDSEQPNDKQVIQYRILQNNILVSTSNGENLKDITVFDLQGRIVYTMDKINRQEINMELTKGMYIIKCNSVKANKNFKVIIY